MEPVRPLLLELFQGTEGEEVESYSIPPFRFTVKRAGGRSTYQVIPDLSPRGAGDAAGDRGGRGRRTKALVHRTPHVQRIGREPEPGGRRGASLPSGTPRG